MNLKRKACDDTESKSIKKRQKSEIAADNSAEVAEMQLCAPPRTLTRTSSRTPTLYVVIVGASLERIRCGADSRRHSGATGSAARFELAECDKHAGKLAERGRDVRRYRPDLLHHMLLACQDSALNRAGMLRLFVATRTHKLIDVAPHTRIPRTYRRFAGLMLDLLQKRALLTHADSDAHTHTQHTRAHSDYLLKMVANPVSRYLPANAPRFALSYSAPHLLPAAKLAQSCVITAPHKLKQQHKLAPSSCPSSDCCVVIGGMAEGGVQEFGSDDVTRELVSIEPYPLSGAYTCCKLIGAFEDLWLPRQAAPDDVTNSSATFTNTTAADDADGERDKLDDAMH